MKVKEKEEILGALARGYCDPMNSRKVMDSDLVIAMEKEIAKIINKKNRKIANLQDFAIWMTGCGYDFCQHEYFIKQRDRLLKA